MTGRQSRQRLDRLVSTAFGGEAGSARFTPLGLKFDELAGVLHREDPGWERWQAVRSDWALCEAELDGAGDTWARRAASGQMPATESSPEWAQAAAAVAGLFEVWPGTDPWVRDTLRGTAGPLVGEPAIARDGDRPVALWELRVLWDERGAHLWREPMVYPLELAPWLEERRVGALTGRPAPTLMQLRRGWLRRFRNPRLSVGAAFDL